MTQDNTTTDGGVGQQDLVELDVEHLATLLRTAFLVPMRGVPGGPTSWWGMPILLIGEPATVKSASAELAAESLNMPCHVIFGSGIEPPDMGGALVADGEGGVNRAPALAEIKMLLRDKIGVLFFDEFGDAPPAIQATMQGAILRRKFGSEDVPPHVRMMLAMNPASMGGWEIRPQMANRVCHVKVRAPDERKWGKWLVNQEELLLQPLEDGEQRIIKYWAEKRRSVAEIYARYHEVHTGQLHILPPEGDPNRGGAWASARSWEMAMRGETTIRCLGDVETCIEETMLHGCIGKNAAELFTAWRDRLDLPTMASILSGDWQPNPTTKLDQAFIAYSTFGKWFESLPEKERGSSALGFWKVVERSEQVGLLDMTTMLSAVGAKKVRPADYSKDVQNIANPLLIRIGRAGMVQHERGV